MFGLVIGAPLFAQDYGAPSFVVNVLPSVIVPIGEYDGRNIRIGLGAHLAVHKSLGDGPLLVGGRLGVARHALRVGDASLTTLSVLGGGGFFFSERPSLAVVGEVGVGLRLGRQTDSSWESGLGAVAEVGADSAFSNSLRAGVRLGYEYWLGQYHGITLSFSGSLALRGRAQPDLVREVDDEPGAEDATMAAEVVVSGRADEFITVTEFQLNQVFPVFYKYYNTNPVGMVQIENRSGRPVSDLQIQFNVPRYMDAPRTADGPAELRPGETASIPFTALFANTIMDVTTATVATAQITVSYTVGGSRRALSLDDTLEIANRNAMTWDDDRKVAAFVTPNDPALQVIARGAASVVREAGYGLVNEPLRQAVGVYEALRVYGLQYVVDPNTPFAEFSTQDQTIDYLQFPGQTIQARGGDCDDLSICYAAALHAIGLDAAFITIPGHIYVAVNTGLTPQEARREFSRLDDLVFQDDTVWIPVEVTILSEGFLRAWEQGAKQWREYAARDEARLYPVSAAAEVYTPTGLRDDYYRPTPPDTDEVMRAYRSQMNRYIDLEILPQVAQLQNRIAGSNSDPRYINRLGVLYARYGLTERALTQFELILEQDPHHTGALVNLGNLHFMESSFEQALDYYERAGSAAPDNAAALLGVARANHELENYGTVSRAYGRLKTLDAALADRFAYLDFRGEDAARAAEMTRVTDIVIWEE